MFYKISSRNVLLIGVIVFSLAIISLTFSTLNTSARPKQSTPQYQRTEENLTYSRPSWQNVQTWATPDVRRRIRIPVSSVIGKLGADHMPIRGISPDGEQAPMDFGSTYYRILRTYTATGGDFTFTSIYADASWIRVSPSRMSIPEGESRTLTVDVDRYNMNEDHYESTVRLLYSGGSDFFRVSMDVSTFSLGGLDFGEVNEPTDYTASVTLHRLEVPFRWRVVALPSWLTVTPTQGTVAAGTDEYEIPLTFTVNPTGLSPGRYQGWMIWTTTVGFFAFPFRVTVPENTPTPTPAEKAISGYVMEAAPFIGLKGVPDVTINLSPENRTQITDAKGYYKFTPSDFGTYQLTCSKSGYRTTTKNVSISSAYPSAQKDIILLPNRCWTHEAECLNALTNVIPILGWPSEFGGFLNKQCQIAELKKQGKPLQAAGLIMWMGVDALDIPGWGDFLDAVEFYERCLQENVDSDLTQFSDAELAGMWFVPKIDISPAIVAIFPQTAQYRSDSVSVARTAPSWELHVYSGDKHLGKVDGKVEHTIPASYLFTGTDGTELAVVKYGLRSYQIRIVGLGSTRSNVTLAIPMSMTEGKLLLYQDIALQNGSIGLISISPSIANPVLELDKDGNGTVDARISPTWTKPLKKELIYLPFNLSATANLSN